MEHTQRNMIVFGTDFLPKYIFLLDSENIIAIGYLGLLISGGLIGFDWMGLFSKVYPELYQKIEEDLKIIKEELHN